MTSCDVHVPSSGSSGSTYVVTEGEMEGGMEGGREEKGKGEKRER